MGTGVHLLPGTVQWGRGVPGLNHWAQPSPLLTTTQGQALSPCRSQSGPPPSRPGEPETWNCLQLLVWNLPFVIPKRLISVLSPVFLQN